MTPAISYEAITAKGAVIHTWADRASAIRWVRENAEAWPGIELEEVERVTRRRRIYKPRPAETVSNVMPLVRRQA